MPKQHEHIADACGHEGFDRRIARGFFCVPETDQQVGAQAHDLPAHKEREQVVGDHERVHAKGEQTDERKETRVHRFDRRTHVYVHALNCRAVRRQTHMVMIACGLTVVVIANAVDEDHQHRPCHKEQDRGRERVDQHTDPQPCVTGWHPVELKIQTDAVPDVPRQAHGRTRSCFQATKGTPRRQPHYGSALCSCS